jgi:hypothetical protein
MSEVLCITGMHRSGTSLTASWLQNCGLNLYDGNLVGPDKGNVKGHFEDKEFLMIHVAALNSRFPNSYGWQVFTIETIDFNEDQLLSAENLIKKRNEKYRYWGWKDPRSVLFLEQWKSLLPNLKFLFIWRSSDEVIRSLVKRSMSNSISHYKISAIGAHNLWLGYNSRIVRFIQEHPQSSLLINIQDLIQFDKDIFKAIKMKFKIDINYSPITNLYEPSLFHYRSGIIKQISSKILPSTSLEQTLKEYSFSK